MTEPVRQPGLSRVARPVEFHDDRPREGHREHSGDGANPIFLTNFNVTKYTNHAPAPVSVDAEAIGSAMQVDGIFVRTGATARSDGAAMTIYDVAKLRRDLMYLQQVDAAAYTETRTMYSSWTVNEARITAFLATWMWERLGWAQSVRAVCAAFPDVPTTTELMWSSLSREPIDPLNRIRSFYVDRLQPSIGVAWALLTRERVTAGHMARIAIQEGALLAGYRALLPRLEAIPEAHRVVSEIIERRTRALEFFTEEAVSRMQRSLGEVFTAAAVLATSGDPLRPAGVRLPKEDWARMSIFARPRDRAALRAAYCAITDHIPRLPRVDVRRYLKIKRRF